MPQGEGNGWAKGRTAANDARVAQNTEAHRGRERGPYAHRLPPEQDKRYRGRSPRTLPLEWSDKMGYVVGLMATDGCLINTGRHLSFDSGDEQLVQTFLNCLGRSLHYRTLPTESGGARYRADFGDVRFYRWLETIGIHQRKSLTIGSIDVPDEFLIPVVRGLFDGDGNVSNFVHNPTRRTYPKYVYERFWVFFNGASRPHLEWIRERLSRSMGIRGYLEQQKPREGRHDYFRLKYGKHASIALMRELYKNLDSPRLVRKWRVWDEYARRNRLS